MHGQFFKWVCIAIGYVFITSGVIKLVSHDFRTMFAHLGFPYPEAILFLIAVIEIACGALIAGRMYTKLASLPLIVIMLGAIFMTKIPIWTSTGFLSFAFEARLDIVMLLLLQLVWRSSPRLIRNG